MEACEGKIGGEAGGIIPAGGDVGMSGCAFGCKPPIGPMSGIGGTGTCNCTGTTGAVGGGAEGEVTVTPHLGHGPVTPASWMGTVSGAWHVEHWKWRTS